MHLSLLLPVEFDVSLHGHVLAEVGELDLDQLLGVERAVPVAARPHRLRQHHAGGEHGLKKQETQLSISGIPSGRVEPNRS